MEEITYLDDQGADGWIILEWILGN